MKHAKTSLLIKRKRNRFIFISVSVNVLHKYFPLGTAPLTVFLLE